MHLASWIMSLNDTAVSLFGSILAASFCDIFSNIKKRRIFLCCMFVIPLAQFIVYARWDEGFLRKIYPLVIHLPLLCLLYILTRRMLSSFISVLTAYLCCQLRRWLGLFVVLVLPYDAITLELVEIVITIPILLLLLHYVSPAIRRLSAYPVRIRCHFGTIPLLYYIFDYMTTVYTDLLTSGSSVVVEFMPFVCCAFYIVFITYDYAEQCKYIRMQQAQNSLEAQLTRASREIDTLRRSQDLTARYRHDMRHHMQYISNCIENGDSDEAQDYISSICEEIEKQKVKQYCENETANLILSSYVSRAQKCGVNMKIDGSLPANVEISNNDLCVLLSNALENALHACLPIVNGGGEATIDVSLREKNAQIFLQVKNPYVGELSFKNGTPMSDKPGHGIGTRSIRAITERYNGICSFVAQDNEFILRLSV